MKLDEIKDTNITSRFDELMSIIKKQACDSWPGEIGDERASLVENLIMTRFSEYSKVLGYSLEEILEAMEKRRTYSAVNFYQKANFPKLDEVEVFATLDDFKKKYPSGKYRCPSCDGISTHPYVCASGDLMSNGKVCDWKAYGFLGTLGKGLRFTFKEVFLENPVIDEIFQPVCGAE